MALSRDELVQGLSQLVLLVDDLCTVYPFATSDQITNELMRLFPGTSWGQMYAWVCIALVTLQERKSHG
jgi:hypothetical protein